MPLPTFVVRIFQKFLESNITNVLKWFHPDDLIATYSKSQFLTSSYELKSMQIQHFCIRVGFSEELLGIKINNNLTFHEHITSKCSKESVKKY